MTKLLPRIGLLMFAAIHMLAYVLVPNHKYEAFICLNIFIAALLVTLALEE